MTVNFEERGLLIAPANMAGQGWAWSRAFTRLTGQPGECWSLWRQSGFDFPCDVVLRGKSDTDLVIPSIAELAERYQAVLLEGALAPNGDRLTPDSLRSMRAVAAAKDCKIGVVFHGSDIRNPRRHRKLERPSVFEDLDAEYGASLQARADMSRRTVEFNRPAVFVSTLDLLDFVPARSVWLPLVVDTRAFSLQDAKAQGSDRPRVLHAPSSRAMKGSGGIHSTLMELDSRGVITYHRIEDASRERLFEALEAADIVVDQIGIGGVGVFALEALAAGRIVLSHASHRTRSRLDQQLPIIEVDQDSLAHEIQRIAEGAIDTAALSESGRKFAERHHDGQRSAQIIRSWIDAGAEERG